MSLSVYKSFQQRLFMWYAGLTARYCSRSAVAMSGLHLSAMCVSGQPSHKRANMRPSTRRQSMSSPKGMSSVVFGSERQYSLTSSMFIIRTKILVLSVSATALCKENGCVSNAVSRSVGPACAEFFVAAEFPGKAYVERSLVEVLL